MIVEMRNLAAVSRLTSLATLFSWSCCSHDDQYQKITRLGVFKHKVFLFELKW